jgi:uncharacterized delta-60 repeat protein
MTLRWLRRRPNAPRSRQPGGRAPLPRVRPRLEVLEARTLLTAGYLDPTFNNGGLLNTQFSPSLVAVQSDGKIVVAGEVVTVQHLSPGPMVEPVLARFNPDGSPDATFAGGEEVIGETQFSLVPSLSALVLQGDGKIVVAGSFGTANAVRRFNPDGSPDATFTADPSLAPGDLGLQPDGKLLVVIRTGVARLDTHGNLDAGFGTGGKVTFPDFLAEGAAVQPDGKVLVAGVGNLPPSGDVGDFAVVRLDAAGQPDPSFGVNGRATTDIFTSQVLVQSDGRIVRTGVNGNNAFAAVRYTAQGLLDLTYGSGGKVSGPEALGGARRAVLQADDKLVAVTSPVLASGNTTPLVRLTTAGQLDPTFGKGGVLPTLFPTENVTVQPDGKLVAVGPPLLARYVPVDDRTPHQRFVAQAYLDLLFRPVDPSGLAHWSRLLDRGVARADVVRAIQASAEYRAAVVRDAYQRLFVRQPDAGGSAAWAQFLAAGASQDQLEASLLGSAEYFSNRAGPTNDSFLATLYHDTLGRAIDPSGQASWGQALAQGASRTDVALAVLGSAEADGVTVDRLYLRFLGRAADDFGRTASTDALQQGVANDAVIADIVGSPEYFHRAQ